MARRGRRPGLLVGYVVALLGCVLIVVAAGQRNFALLLLGTFCFGGATASGSQSRYAAADLALPTHRGRDLSLVVWATTIGSVAGPNLVGPAAPLGAALHLPDLAGSYVFSMLGFVVALGVVSLRLRPDPLLLSRTLAAGSPDASVESPHRSIPAALGVIAAHPSATLGLLAMATGHAVMVSVMVMTPIHMHHGGAALHLIGLVISTHILGMYVFSPVVGTAVDRYGGRRVALAGSLVLVVATLMASRASEGMSVTITIALFLLGVGWSGTFVSGSALLTSGVPAPERPGAQGVSDLCTGLAGALGGAAAGIVIGAWGYGALALGCALASVAVTGATLTLRADGSGPSRQ